MVACERVVVRSVRISIENLIYFASANISCTIHRYVKVHPKFRADNAQSAEHSQQSSRRATASQKGHWLTRFLQLTERACRRRSSTYAHFRACLVPHRPLRVLYLTDVDSHSVVSVWKPSTASRLDQFWSDRLSTRWVLLHSWICRTLLARFRSR